MFYNLFKTSRLYFPFSYSSDHSLTYPNKFLVADYILLPSFHPMSSRRFLIPEFNFSPQRQSRDKMVNGKKGYNAISTPGVQIFEKNFFYPISTNRGTRSYKQKFFDISAHSKYSQFSAVVSVPSGPRTEKVIFFLDAQ